MYQNGVYKTGNWENQEYEEINRKIVDVMARRDRIAVRQDRYIALHGEESEEISEDYNRLTDKLEDLCQERDEISKKMNS